MKPKGPINLESYDLTISIVISKKDIKKTVIKNWGAFSISCIYII